jgi:hypothetical protein
MRKSILKILIFSLCISAAIGILIILTGSFGDIEGKILVTTFSVFAFSISGFCCSTIYEQYQSFSKFGIFSCLLACIWTILIDWGFLNLFPSTSSFTWRVMLTLLILSYSSAHISLMLLIKNQNSIVNNIKNLTIGFSVLIDVMILAAVWEFTTFSSTYTKLIYVLAILITLGTIVSPVLNKAYRNASSVSNSPNPENNSNQQTVELQNQTEVVNNNEPNSNL